MHALEFYVMFFTLEIAGNGKKKKAEVGQLLLWSKYHDIHISSSNSPSDCTSYLGGEIEILAHDVDFWEKKVWAFYKRPQLQSLNWETETWLTVK